MAWFHTLPNSFANNQASIRTHSLHKHKRHNVNGIQTQHLHGLMNLTNEVACLRIDMACANRVKATSSVFIHPWLLTAATSISLIPRRLGNIWYYSANDCFAARRNWTLSCRVRWLSIIETWNSSKWHLKIQFLVCRRHTSPRPEIYWLMSVREIFDVRMI